MNILDLTQAGGFPLRQDRLKFLQDSITRAFAGLGNAPRILIAFDAGTGEPINGQAYVLYGCEITNNGDGTITVSNGAIFQENEVFDVIEHTIVFSTAANTIHHFNTELVDDPSGIKEYADGDSHPTQKIRRAKLQFTTYASSGDYLAALFTVAQTKVIATNVGGVWSAPTFLDAISIPVRTLAPTNNWNASHNGKVNLFAHHNGRIDVTAHLMPNAGTFPSSNVLCTLPQGYRPNTELWHYLGHFGGEATYLKIATSGVCSFVDGANNVSSALEQLPISFNITFLK